MIFLPSSTTRTRVPVRDTLLPRRGEGNWGQYKRESSPLHDDVEGLGVRVKNRTLFNAHTNESVNEIIYGFSATQSRRDFHPKGTRFSPNARAEPAEASVQG